jgi:D-serine deaminase-like pyridoxal phosphate-dependent protein
MTMPSQIDTPAAIVDRARMQANIERMQQRMDTLGVRFRPHVKTTKCVPVVRAQLEAGAQGITVSTLKEAEQFFAEGIADILYAVGIVPGKLGKVMALRRQGCSLKIITDNATSAAAIVAFGREHGEIFEVWIEIDCDGHRSGIQPDDTAQLLEVAHVLTAGGMQLGGVMTHAGSSYDLDKPETLGLMAERERSACVSRRRAYS